MRKFLSDQVKICRNFGLDISIRHSEQTRIRADWTEHETTVSEPSVPEHACYGGSLPTPVSSKSHL